MRRRIAGAARRGHRRITSRAPRTVSQEAGPRAASTYAIRPTNTHPQPDNAIALGLDAVISGWLDEFPRIRAGMNCVIVRSAAKSRLHVVELFVRDAHTPHAARRTLIIHVCPESLCPPRQARDIFLRELMHVADMLDPQFGYEPLVIGGSPAKAQLIKDRYRVLWDIHVERRQSRLLQLARLGMRAVWIETFEWADPADAAFKIAIERLAPLEPDWSPASGLCQRCVDVLASRRRRSIGERIVRRVLRCT